jgi:hypothetical protein
MPLIKLSLPGNNLNYSQPGRVWFVTRLRAGKSIIFFYSEGVYGITVSTYIVAKIRTIECMITQFTVESRQWAQVLTPPHSSTRREGR